MVLVALLALAMAFHPQRACRGPDGRASAASPVVIATIGVGDSPAGVAVSPDGSRVYTANFNGRSVSVVDAASKRLTATIPVGHFPYGVGCSPDGARVYATNSGDNSVSVIDARTNTVTKPSRHGRRGPNGIAVSPDGLHVYAANFDGRSVSVIDAHTLDRDGHHRGRRRPGYRPLRRCGIP